MRTLAELGPGLAYVMEQTTTSSLTTPAERLAAIRSRIAHAERAAGRPEGATTLVAVSKTFPAEDVAALIALGHRVFGENRVQEAKAKFPALEAATPDLELHLIGPLQSNKAREAVALFDVIHTIDREKIAAAIAEEIARAGWAPKLLVQVNTGEEPQKAGIAPGRPKPSCGAAATPSGSRSRG